MTTKKWTEEEEEFLKNNYTNLSNADLADKFNITKNAIQKKLSRMGLKRSENSEEIMEEDEDDDDEENDDDNKESLPSLVKMELHYDKGNEFYFKDRNYVQAIEEFKKSIAEDPDEEIKLKAKYWMAESYVKIQKIDEATEIFKSLAEYNKKHYLSNSAKRRLEALKEYIRPKT